MATLLVMALRQESQGLFEAQSIQPLYCGVGLVNASFYLQKHIITSAAANSKISRVVNLGTAGSPTFKQGSLVECTSFVQRRTGLQIPVQSIVLHIPAITSLAPVTCGSADFVETTTSPHTKCDIMDMEAYSLAFVCQQYKIPFHCIKYISDHSDTNTVNDWKKNLQHSAESLLKIYNEYFKNL